MDRVCTRRYAGRRLGILLVVVAAAASLTAAAGAATCDVASRGTTHGTRGEIVRHGERMDPPADRSWSDVGVRLLDGAQLRRVDTSAEHIVSGGKRSLALLVIAFVVTFALTRLYTRRARAFGGGGLEIEGVHVHHLVFGIVIAFVSALLTIALEPAGLPRDTLAVGFGIGAALTLDEFALWFYLRDVYWSPEGRTSIRATGLGMLVAVLVLIGRSPFGIGEAAGVPRAAVVPLVVLNVAVSLVAVLKGKPFLALLSVFVPVVGFLAAVRLAKPGSLWAKCFYAGNRRKAVRADARYGECSRFERVQRSLADLVGGAHGPVVAARCLTTAAR
jgi:hypothetical protein